MLIISILVALMVGGFIGVALMCMLTAAARADADEAQDAHIPGTMLASAGTRTWGIGAAPKRMHRAAARGEVACMPWAGGKAAKPRMPRQRTARA